MDSPLRKESTEIEMDRCLDLENNLEMGAGLPIYRQHHETEGLGDMTSAVQLIQLWS